MPAAHDPEETRQRIIVEARRLFIAEGPSAVSLNRFCREVKIAKKTFYLHFADKQALVEVVVRETFSAFAQAVQDALSQPDGDRVGLVLRAAFQTSVRHTSARFLSDLAHDYPSLWALLKQGRAVLVSFLTEEITRGQDQGRYREDVDMRAFATLVETLVDRVLDPPELVARGMEPGKTAELLYKVLSRGLTPEWRESGAL